MTAGRADDSGAWPGAGGPTTALVDEGAMRPLLLEALAASGTAAWHTDLVTRERWWSEHMFALHGLAPGQAVPADYLDLVVPEDRQAVEQAFRSSVQTGRHRIEYRVRWPDGSVHWLEGRGRSRLQQGRPVGISGVCQLIDGRKREEADLGFLAEASLEFARSIDFEETLRRIAAMAVPRFADWCSVDMLDERGQLRRVAVAHVDAAKVDLARRLYEQYPPQPEAPTGAWHVIRSGRPELLAQISDEMLARGAVDAEHLAILRSLGLRSYMGLPIATQAGTLGVISFVSAESGRVYGPRDLDVAAQLASRAAMAIRNATLFQQLHSSQRRQDFLLRLTDMLRRSGTTVEVLGGVSELLGRQFGVNRVGYGHVDARLDRIDFDVCWTDGSVPSLRGRFPASAFGALVIERLRGGYTVAIANVRSHALTSDEAAQRTSHEVDTRAILVVPLFRAGRLRTIVYLNQRAPRHWTLEEVGLMEEVAERTRELIERGRTEAALRASEARWRGLFERMKEGFFVAEALRDAEGRMVDFRFLQANPAFERLTGVPVASAVGRALSEVIAGPHQPLVEPYVDVVDTGEPKEFEAQVPALDDRWYEVRAMRLAPDQFSALFVEISDRKRAQQALERSAERYRTLFESIDEGFCIIELLFDAAGQACDYRFVEFNPAFERQSGLRAVQGRTIRELVPHIDESYIQTYARVAATGRALRFESQARALQRWFDTFAFPVGEPAEHRVGLLFTDITERRRVQDELLAREAQLRLADQRKNEFLATLAHELRNPLAPLSNALMILRHAQASDASALRARDLMERQLNHLVRLVDDLLDVSRVSEGKITLKKEATTLQAVVETALETSRPLVEAAGHRLQIELPVQPMPLQVDPTRIAQVLSNLLNNAAKYTPPGGHLRLAARRDAGRLRLEIEDDGVGIPPDMLEDVFELFTQVGSALERSQGGLGIGLSLARRLVELHQGRIQAFSAGPGLGSRFVVELPLAPAAMPEPAAAPAAVEAPRALRLLVVDDNVDAAESLQMLLALDGHEVHLAHTGTAALDAVRRLAPDLVFLDIGLPDINGYDVARTLRADPGGAALVLVALTGWGAPGDQQRASAAGVDLHLTKPVGPAELDRALALVTARHSG
jgi:PAS domain S-box-containing protein